MREQAEIVGDLEALSAITERVAGSAGERAMIDVLRGRLPDAEAARVEGFVGHTAPWFVLAVHGVAALVSGAVGWWFPRLGAIGGLLTTASLVGEGTGRLALFRLWLPRSPSYNLVVPPRGPEAPLGAVVLCAPLDVPRVRLRRRVRPKRPLLGVFASTVLLTVLLLLRALAEPWGNPLLALYAACLAVSAATALGVALALRVPARETEDGSGPATLLALHRRLRADPPPGIEVWTVFTGCGHAHQDGLRAFLRVRGARMPDPLLVVSLTDAGRPPLSAAVSEGPLFPQAHRPTGPALAERLRWAGVRIPLVDHPEATDGRAATQLGYRALSLVGGAGAADAASVGRAVDVAERLVHGFAKDVATVRSLPDTPVTP